MSFVLPRKYWSMLIGLSKTLGEILFTPTCLPFVAFDFYLPGKLGERIEFMVQFINGGELWQPQKRKFTAEVPEH